MTLYTRLKDILVLVRTSETKRFEHSNVERHLVVPKNLQHLMLMQVGFALPGTTRRSYVYWDSYNRERESEKHKMIRRPQQRQPTLSKQWTVSCCCTIIPMLLVHRIAVLVEAFQIFSNAMPTATTPSFLRNPDNRNDNYHPRCGSIKSRARINDDEDEDDDSKLRRRMYPLQIATLEQIFQRSLPISTIPCTTTTLKNNQGHQDESHQAHHHPIPFIEFCFHCLLNNDQPYPDSGIRFLLRVSTPTWRHKIYQSVGYHYKNTTLRQGVAIEDASIEERMISAISATMAQDQNQFGILVGEGEPYRICFPSEPLEYDDDMSSSSLLTEKNIAGMENDLLPSSTITTSTSTGSTVWIECQLRHYDTNELLVMMGWQLRVLVHHNDDGDDDDDDNHRKEYQIDRVDWQDFREQFRPGIGREEWVRICG